MTTMIVKQAIHRVSFLGVPLTQSITGVGTVIGGAPNYVFPAPILLSALPSVCPQFWIESDSDGVPALCTTKTVGTEAIVIYLSGGIYTQKLGISFEVVDNGQGGTNYIPKAQA